MLGAQVVGRHPVVHVRANGRETCVDERIARLVTRLWMRDDRLRVGQDDGDCWLEPGRGATAGLRARLRSLGVPFEDRGGRFVLLPGAFDQVPPAEPATVTSALGWVRGATAHLERFRAGHEHVRLEDARSLLRDADTWLDTAANADYNALRRPDGQQRVAGMLLDAGWVFLPALPLIWVFARFTGGSLLWTAVVAVLAPQIWGFLPVLRWRSRLEARLLAWQVARQRPPVRVREPVAGAPDLGPGAALDLQLAFDTLERAQLDIGHVAMRLLQDAPHRVPRSAAGARWLVRHDRRFLAIHEAGLALAEAADHLSLWVRGHGEEQE